MAKKKEISVFDNYLIALNAWQAIPRQPFKRELSQDGNTETFSCPSCGNIFAQISKPALGIRFDMLPFCCGKLLY